MIRLPRTTRAYIRISTLEKGQNSISLELQKKFILEFCSPKVPIFYEDIASAGNVYRPGYMKLLEDLRRGDRLIIYRLDRLTRNSFDFADLWRGYIKKKKIDFCCVAENFNTRTPDGLFQIKLKVDFADYEREMIKTRTREALAVKRKQGLIISRYIPYGYERNGKYLKPLPEEQRGIRLMKKWREAGKTYEDIARTLKKRGLSPKRGPVWRAYVVRDILQREAKIQSNP